MKLLILAGGVGSRLSELTKNVPKPMIEIGSKPIIWHIMKIYSAVGITDFIILVGYKADYFSEMIHRFAEPHWDITILETGEGTLKSQRILKAEQFITDEHFFVAYGDDLSDINPLNVYNEHRKFPNRLVTLAAMPLESNYGVLELGKDNAVIRFQEKPRIEGYWINGGFFCFSRGIFDYFNNDTEELEEQIFARLSHEGKIGAYLHNGFWKSMNTLKEKNEMDNLINKNQAKWITWN